MTGAQGSEQSIVKGKNCPHLALPGKTLTSKSISRPFLSTALDMLNVDTIETIAIQAVSSARPFPAQDLKRSGEHQLG
jgi:hypothetical protein